MNLLTRAQFRKKFNKETDDRILWLPERAASITCHWFVNLKVNCPSDYWDWCNNNLKGHVRCFSSGDEEEWWGFTNKDDISLWVLRFS